MMPSTWEEGRDLICEILVRYMRRGRRDPGVYDDRFLTGMADCGYIEWLRNKQTNVQTIKTTGVGKVCLSIYGCRFPWIKHFVRYGLRGGSA